MIFVVARHHKHEHHKHEHHRHAHHKIDEPKSKLRKLAVPITLIVMLAYAAQWAARFTLAQIKLAAGIAITAAAASLWILRPRKGR